MAEVEEHGAIFEDEEFDDVDLDDSEEDWEGSEDEDENNNLYDSPLDQVNEIIFFHEKMSSL